MAERLRPTNFPGLPISNLVLTDAQLGVGSNATVFEADWNGTICAAKRLHQILLQDQSFGGAEKLISNFEAECITWSKLRHPGVVQFLGVYLERGSLLPVLVIEKMDISLRRYCDSHSKEEFTLHLKAFVLRQVCQALAYLHNHNPPLVHHDVTPNNVLLNEVSFVTKVTDFGMSRAINPSATCQKSSIKGTKAFMSPEALQNPPQYDEKLDVFSFGSIILSTLSHEWPEPEPPTKYEGDKIVGLTELQRRERYVLLFTTQEKQLLLSTVCRCLENRPCKRPSSAVLVQELRRVELSLSKGSRFSAPSEQLYHQLPAKEEEYANMNNATIEQQQFTIQKQQSANQFLCTTIQSQQATIQAQQAEIEQLRKQPAVAQQCNTSSQYSRGSPVINGNESFTNFEVQLLHCNNRLGFSIIGGREKESLASISAIVPGGVAHLDGKLWIGDEITQINGLNVMNATHHEVLELMTEAETHGKVTLSIRRKLPPAIASYPPGNPIDQGQPTVNPQGTAPVTRQPSSPYVVEVVLERPTWECRFGLVLQSCMLNKGCKIIDLLPGSPAARCGQLCKGDTILTVNSQDVTNIAHSDALSLICSVLTIHLLVQRQDRWWSGQWERLRDRLIGTA